MGTLKRMCFIVLTAVLVLASVYVALRAFSVLEQGYAWADMDWNNDGTTTWREFFEAGDVGTRQVRKGGRICDEYFALKDGMTLKLRCAH